MKAMIILFLVWSGVVQSMDVANNQPTTARTRSVWKTVSQLVEHICTRQLLLYDNRTAGKIKELMKFSLGDGDFMVVNDIRAELQKIKTMSLDPSAKASPSFLKDIQKIDTALYMRMLRQTIADFVNERDVYHTTAPTTIDLSSCSDERIRQSAQWLHMYVILHRCIHCPQETLALLKREMKDFVMRGDASSQPAPLNNLQMLNGRDGSDKQE